MKKILSFLAVMAMAASMVSCSDKKSSKKDKDPDTSAAFADDSEFEDAPTTEPVQNVTKRECSIDLGNGVKSGTYTGEWRGDSPCGKGEFTYNTATKATVCLEGEFEDNALCDSEVKYTKTNVLTGLKISYFGGFKNGVFEGKGEYKCEDTKKKETIESSGDFKNGDLNGNVVASIIGSDYSCKYEGEMVNGKRNGKGVSEETDKNGVRKVWDGEFKDDYPDGSLRLTIYNSDNEYTVVEGSFAKGAVIGEAPYIKFKNGKQTDTGVYKNGKFKSDKTQSIVDIVGGIIDIFGDNDDKLLFGIGKFITGYD